MCCEVVAPSLTPESYNQETLKSPPSFGCAGIFLWIPLSEEQHLLGGDLFFLKKRHADKQANSGKLFFGYGHAAH